MSLGSIAGCGNTYRPVVTSINPVGPAAQPPRFAVVISNPGPNLPGLLTIVDFSGDSVLITANIGVSPYFLMLNAAGNTGYTLNGDGTMTSLDISTTVQTRDVVQTTLLANAAPNSIFSDTTSLFITEPGRTAVAQLTETPPPPSLNQEFPIDPGYSPVWIAGYSGSPRAYVVSQNNTPSARGEVAAIEIASSTISTKIDVGVNPVYGVMTSDGKRAFIMNKGDNTVTVINAQTNQLDVGPLPHASPRSIPFPSGPLPSGPTSPPRATSLLSPTKATEPLRDPSALSISLSARRQRFPETQTAIRIIPSTPTVSVRFLRQCRSASILRWWLSFRTDLARM